MSSRWVPHGLIQDQRDEEDYQAARITIDEHGNIIDPKEYRTVHLFEGLFKEVLFPGRNFKVSSQYPPSDKKGVDKACDIAIRFVDSEYKWHILCFAEAKRARKTNRASIRDLEDQAELYCEAFLEGHPEQDVVYACTLVGVSVRCWRLTRDDRHLKGLWDDDRKDHIEFYKDVGEDANKQLLERAFAMMKSLPTGPLRIDQDYSQIGTLPHANPGTHLASTPSAGYAVPYETSAQTYNMGEPANFSGYAQQTVYTQPSAASMEWEPVQTSRVVPGATISQHIYLQNENYVTVTLVHRGASISENRYQFRTAAGKVEKSGADFFQSNDPEGHPCMVYYGTNSGIYYWTRTLDPDDSLVLRDKGKGKEGHHRRH